HGGPSTVHEHERPLGWPGEFKQSENGGQFSRAMVSQRSLYANPGVLGGVQAIAGRPLAERSRVGLAPAPQTPLPRHLAAPTRLGDVAKQLGISRRSLQRKLAAEQVSFEKLVDECRRERALELLRQDMTVAAIAATVGFAGARPFVRAFRRWTSMS